MDLLASRTEDLRTQEVENSGIEEVEKLNHLLSIEKTRYENLVQQYTYVKATFERLLKK